MSHDIKVVLNNVLETLKHYREDCESFEFSGMAQGITEVENQVSSLMEELANQTHPSVICITDHQNNVIAFEDVERMFLEKALKLIKNYSKAARQIKMGRSTLYRKLEGYDLPKKLSFQNQDQLA